jgi:hypothetical protein
VAHPLQFHRKGWVAVAVAFAFAIAVACPFVCHSAAQRRNLLSPLLSPLLVLSPASNPKSLVISTEATDSLIVCCAVERSPHFAFVLSFASRYHKASALGLYTSAKREGALESAEEVGFA